MHAHLGGDDPGHAGLAQPGRAGQQHVVSSLTAALGGLQDDAQMLLELTLADEFGQPARSQPGVVDDFGLADRLRVEELVTHAGSQDLQGVAQHRRRVGARGDLTQHVAHLLGSVAKTGEGLAHVGHHTRATARRPDGVEHGHVQPVAQLHQQALGGLLADTRHHGQCCQVVAGHDIGQRQRRMRAENGHGQGGADPVGGDQLLERAALVAAEEAEEQLGVLADVVVDVEEGRRRGLQLGQGARRDVHDVADPGHLQQHRGIVGALQHRAAQRPDHSPTARNRRRIGAAAK